MINRRPMGWLFWRNEMKAFHFCAEYRNESGLSQIYDGILSTNMGVFEDDFLDNARTSIAEGMKPPRIPSSVIIRSLTLIGER